MKEFRFNEDLLHYIWRYRKFDHSSLYTHQKEKIEILHPGTLNENAGPDFLNASIKISDTVWAGHVEIHKKASEWIHHKHQNDPAYENVVLHVVHTMDKEIKYPNGKPIPCITLCERIDDQLLETYNKIIFNADWIPCAAHLDSVPNIKLRFWLERLLSERLLRKSNDILKNLTEFKGDWDRLCYCLIAQYLGKKPNDKSFFELFARTPFEVLLKHKDNLFQLEAILFGQSGLLSDRDEYERELKKEYSFLKKKYKLENMRPVEWKFSRMRPFNFPTLRIAQLSSLIHEHTRIFQTIIDNKIEYSQLQHYFSVQGSAYWNTHYRFGKESKLLVKKVGSASIDNITINVIVPLLFSYGEILSKNELKEYAIELIQSLKPEKNKIIRKWKEHKIVPRDAADTQALIQLKKEYCDPIKCLQCSIGNHLLSPNK